MTFDTQHQYLNQNQGFVLIDFTHLEQIPKAQFVPKYFHKVSLISKLLALIDQKSFTGDAKCNFGPVFCLFRALHVNFYTI